MQGILGRAKVALLSPPPPAQYSPNAPYIRVVMLGSKLCILVISGI